MKGTREVGLLNDLRGGATDGGLSQGQNRRWGTYGGVSTRTLQSLWLSGCLGLERSCHLQSQLDIVICLHASMEKKVL